MIAVCFFDRYKIRLIDLFHFAGIFLKFTYLSGEVEKNNNCYLVKKYESVVFCKRGWTALIAFGGCF